MAYPFWDPIPNQSDHALHGTITATEYITSSQLMPIETNFYLLGT